jgi:hypothetical protein
MYPPPHMTLDSVGMYAQCIYLHHAYTHTYGRVSGGLALLLDVVEQRHDQLSAVITCCCRVFLFFFQFFISSYPPSLLAVLFLCGIHTLFLKDTQATRVCVCVCV